MIDFEYSKLSKDLQDLVRLIPLKWGMIQNDNTDANINMFAIHSFSKLEKVICQLSEDQKNYFRRRWYLWKCAQCDEYLFYKHKEITPNPNSRDQAYDIEFFNNQHLRFDLKGTVIPKKMRNSTLIMNDQLINEMVNFYYLQQSKGVRNNTQNRLFIVHHSERNNDREMYLRAHWAFKDIVYTEYLKHLSTSPKLLTYNNVICDLIFIIENKNKEMDFYFASKG